MIGEGGNALSGGEKQRLSIARAMLKDLGIGIIFEKENINTLMQKAKCFLLFFPLWLRTRADPFQRTAHGESAGGLKQESTK